MVEHIGASPAGEPPIQIINATLDVHEDHFVLHGFIEPACLHLLKVDKYQREVLSGSHVNKIARGFYEVGGVPDIILGMRGSSHVQTGKNGYLLKDPVYIIDGLQRVSAAKKVLESGRMPHLGASIHFDSTYAFEKHRFEVLNLNQSHIGAGVIIKNQEENPAVALLLQLSHESGFALGGKISWTQRQQRGELLKARTLLYVACVLHQRMGTGLKGTGNLALCEGLGRLYGLIGRKAMRQNLIDFYDLIDQAFDIRNVAYAESAVHLKAGFLVALASVLSAHQEFWEDSRLVVPVELKRKLRSFPIKDPTIITMSASGSSGSKLLSQHIINHFNSNKQKHRHLKRFDQAITCFEGDSYADAA